jgi:phage tail-like protein
MATDRTISENRFGVELDGIAAFRASKITGGEETHESVETTVGNDPRPRLGRGNIKTENVVITIPSGLYDEAIRALHAWIKAYFDGVNTEPKSGRRITYDDAGRVPVETWEMQDCVPISLKPDDMTGDGNNTATVTLTIKPYKMELI